MEWSLYISTQRLRWLGHALRLPEDSPAKQALYEIEKPTKQCYIQVWKTPTFCGALILCHT